MPVSSMLSEIWDSSVAFEIRRENQDLSHLYTYFHRSPVRCKPHELPFAHIARCIWSAHPREGGQLPHHAHTTTNSTR